MLHHSSALAGDMITRHGPTRLEAMLEQRSMRGLIGMLKASHAGYQAGRVHHRVARILERFSDDVAAGKSPRVILTMPPRTGKSMMTSERWPVYHLSRHPDHEIVVASYSLDPARDRTREARNVAIGHGAALPFGISGDTRAKASWRVEGHSGGVLAVGATGSLTGKGAHALIIDDPHKDWREAYSPGKRQEVWDWYQSTAYTRLAPGGGVLVIATRWHEDDLIGRLLEEQRRGGEKWEVIELPAISEADEYDEDGELFRCEGDALDPVRWPLESLERIRETVGPLKWRALYQCRPSTPAGSVFRREWWRHWTGDAPSAEQMAAGWVIKPERFSMIILSWDLTFGSQSKTASFVVGHAWGLAGRDFFLLEEARGRWKFSESARRVAAMAARWKGGYTLIEDKANGPAVIDHLRQQGIVVRGVSVDGSKEVRAHAISPLCEAGRVYLPDPNAAPWVSQYIDEMSSFPDGANDDRVDTTSQALRFLARRAV